MEEITGSLGIVECATCESTRFAIPSSENNDPLIKCRCGAIVGPIFSLRAFANGEAHAHVNANLQKVL